MQPRPLVAPVRPLQLEAHCGPAVADILRRVRCFYQLMNFPFCPRLLHPRLFQNHRAPSAVFPAQPAIALLLLRLRRQESSLLSIGREDSLLPANEFGLLSCQVRRVRFFFSFEMDQFLAFQVPSDLHACLYGSVDVFVSVCRDFDWFCE